MTQSRKVPVVEWTSGVTGMEEANMIADLVVILVVKEVLERTGKRIEVSYK